MRGTFDESLRAAQALGDSGRYVLVNSLNPYRIEGQKTAAFEIAEELGRVPDVLALPYGGGGNTRAYARGFTEWEAGMPRFLAGAAARRGETLASAIRIVDPAHRAEAEAAVRDSGGAVVALTDDEIVVAWRLLAEQEGVFCEPASAAGLAAVQKLGASGTVVVVVTGHGLEGPRRSRPHRRAHRRGRRRCDRGGLCVTELVRVRAPASTANLGPGFDCAAAALDLWNELVVTEGGEPDPAHLGIRAYGLVADPSGLGFDFSLDDPARARARLERVDHRARHGRGDVRERRRPRP